MQKGQEKLLDQPGIALDRMPMINSIFDRIASLSMDYLRPYSYVPASFFVNHIGVDHIWDIMDSYEGSIVAILYCAEWDARILVGLDRRFVFSFIEALLGGSGEEKAFDDDRSFTNIEIQICQLIFENLTRAFQVAFSDLTPSSFKIERVETKPDFTVMGRRNSLSIVTKILFQVLDQGGQLFILIPQASRAYIRPYLSRDYTIEQGNNDPKWIMQLEDGVKKAEVTLYALLDSYDGTLADVASLHVGDLIKLSTYVQSPLKIISNGISLFDGTLGQHQGKYTMTIVSETQDDDPFKFYRLNDTYISDIDCEITS
jgi:flagellar motor switch protein FliM